MLKVFLAVFLLFVSAIASAQTPDASAVYNSYLDLNLAMLEGDMDKAISLSNTIMPDTAALPVKARVSYYNIMGKLYEESDTNEAIKYYARVAAAVPDYYVVHRALGYLYLKKSGDVTSIDFASLAKKALFHLEKAQACDPSDETLEIIKGMYKRLNDEAGLKTLDKRLSVKAKNCIDILPSE
jgi:tetratricopeptide (TPR) repeat protein